MRVHKKARAKINLNLLITGVRSDGYHLLSSFFTFAEFGDEIFLEPADALVLEITGPFADDLVADEKNSVVKAVHGLAKLCGCEPKVKIVLDKQVPVAAGLGGGTADAAATLIGLCELWNVVPNRQDLYALAISLGADVPASLNGRPALVGGIGDVLLPVPVIETDVFVVLVNPRVMVPTAQVFAGFDGNFSVPFTFKDHYKTADELVADLAKTGNDLYVPAIKIAPEISDVLKIINENKNCLFSAMSGSGATCFGLYNSQKCAESALDHIMQKHRNWWGKAARLNLSA